MEKSQNHVNSNDSVYKPIQNGDLAKSLNTLRTVPGAKNPYVTSQVRSSSNGTSGSNTSSGAQTGKK